jgi:hypothetical protein
MGGIRNQAVLLEVTGLNLDLTFAAGQAAATDTFNFDPHLPGSIQQRLPRYNPAAPAGGHKNHQGWLIRTSIILGHTLLL